MDLRSIDGKITLARARQDLVWQRIKSQIEFAEFLSRRPDAPAEWRLAVDNARSIATEGAGSATAPADVCKSVEAALALLACEAKNYRVRLVGHAHIDMNWMWSWPETVSITCDTFSTVLDLLDEFPAFRFTQSQASVYAIVAEHRPDLLARIEAKVREGRWEVAASHWVEGDKNLAGGESLARHLLYTRRYLDTILPGAIPGGKVEIDWSPDTFGHAATVPTYLNRGGVKYLYLHRPGCWQQPVPEAFWWEAPDGSRVLVRNDQKRGYNGMVEPSFVTSVVRDMAESTGAHESMLVYGVGDHGGGPTRRDILFGLEMQSWPVFPAVVFDTAAAFFKSLEAAGAALPVIRGELNTEFSGCYTSQSLVKRSARLGEARLTDAESACALVAATGGPDYPARRFEEAWRKVLFLHFHDILPGSCVRDTRTHAHGLFQEAAAIAAAAETYALRNLASRVATVDLPGANIPALEAVPVNILTSGQGAGAGIRAFEGRLSDAHGHGATSPLRPFVVFNPTARDRHEVVELTLWDREPWGAPTHIKDTVFEAVLPNGDVFEPQHAGDGYEWGHAFQRVRLPLAVPGFGYAAVLIREKGSDPRHAARCAVADADRARQLARGHHCFYAGIDRNDIGLENGLVRAVFDRATGRLVSFFDKARGVELLDAATGGAGLEYAVERPHGGTAWTIENTGPVEFPALVHVRPLSNGPYSAALELAFHVAESDVAVRYELAAEDPSLRIHVRATWMQRGTPQTGVPTLRFGLPTDLADAEPTYEIPFGSIKRVGLLPDEEVPALRWAHIGGAADGADAGILLLNDCKSGHAMDGATLRLNLLRSTYDPDPLPEVGEHEMNLCIAPAPRACDAAAVTAAADAFCHALKPVGTGVHAGTLPLSASILRVEGDNIAVSGLKQTEEGKGLVLRLYETGGHPATASISPFSALGVLDGTAVNFHEEPTGEATPREGAAILVSIPPHGIRSVRLA